MADTPIILQAEQNKHGALKIFFIVLSIYIGLAAIQLCVLFASGYENAGTPLPIMADFLSTVLLIVGAALFFLLIYVLLLILREAYAKFTGERR